MSDEHGADKTTVDDFNQFMTQFLELNGKGMFETFLRQQESLTSQHVRDVDDKARFVDQLTAFALRTAEANQTLILRMANDAATASQRNASAAESLSQRILQNAATLDAVIGANAITANEAAQAADNRMMTDLANKFQNEAKAAMEAGIAAAVQSNPVNQGTTGVAQAGLQTNAAVAIDAINANIVALNSVVAKLAEVMGEFMVVTASEVARKAPAA